MDSQVQSTFTYSEDLQGKTFSLLLLFSRHPSLNFYATPNSENSFIIRTHLEALYYTDQQYSLCRIIEYIGIAIVALSLVACIGGAFAPHRLAGL